MKLLPVGDAIDHNVDLNQTYTIEVEGKTYTSLRVVVAFILPEENRGVFRDKKGFLIEKHINDISPFDYFNSLTNNDWVKPQVEKDHE